MKKIVVALTAVAVLTGAAQAADLILEAPAVEAATVHDWSGFYAGIVGGYGVGTASSSASNIPISGPLAGINLGVNQQMDGFVLGAEGDVLWSGITGSEPCDAFPAQTCGGSLQWLASLRGRAGVAVESWLLYGTLGVAAAGFTATTTPATPGTTGTFSGTGFGWTAGIGAEVAVAENVSVKAEYAYYGLGPVRTPAGTIGTGTFDITSGLHTGKVGVNFQF